MPARRVGGAVLAIALVAAAAFAAADAPATRHVTLSDGAVVALTQVGSGPPLVFLHGWACDRTHWRHQIPVFAADHTVVALDLPGHGESTGTRETWSIEQYGEDVNAVVRQLGLDRVVLVGHSMGGPVALEAARRLGPLVIGVVGVDTLHNVEARMQGKQVDELRAAYEKDFAGQCVKAVPFMFTPSSDPALVKEVTAGLCATRPEVASALFGDFTVYDNAAALAAVTVPVRVINAQWQPTRLDINRKYSPGFDATVIEGPGHFVMLEAPDRFNEALRSTLQSISTVATP